MADRRGNPRIRAAAPLLAGLLALGLVACSGTPSASSEAASTAPTVPAPTVVPTTAPTSSPEAPTIAPATAAPSAVAGGTACAAADLKASHDLVEGAAGSRITTVVLVAARACSVDLFPSMGIRDGDGKELVASTTAGAGRIDLDPDASYSAAVRFANWCDPEPKYPLELVIRIGPEEVAVTGSSFPEAGDMPPCNGVGGPRLEAEQWAAAP